MDIVLTEADINRFYAKITIDPITECHNFTGYKDKNGYGNLRVNHHALLPHRIGWVLQNGQIEDNKFICHKCDNPSCCNPEHLFLGTQDDNLKDMAQKGRSHKGFKLTDKDVLDIYKLKNISNYTEVGKKYDVHESTISRIMNKLTYKNVLNTIN